MIKSLIALFALTSAVKVNTEVQDDLWEWERDEGFEFSVVDFEGGSLDATSFIYDRCSWGTDDPEACEEFYNQKYKEFRERIDKRRCVTGHFQFPLDGEKRGKFEEGKFCFDE